MSFATAFVRRFPAAVQAALRQTYDLQAGNLRRSLVHLSSDPAVVVAVQQFVGLAYAVGDPRGLLEYFEPLLDFLELATQERKDLRAMSRAARQMASAAARARLSKRQVGRLRRYADALNLVADSEACLVAMECACDSIAAKLKRSEEITAEDGREIERDLRRVERYSAEHRQRRQEIRRVLLPPVVRRQARTLRCRRTRRIPRRPTARRAQSDSGGGVNADGDGDPEPPGLRGRFARSPSFARQSPNTQLAAPCTPADATAPRRETRAR